MSQDLAQRIREVEIRLANIVRIGTVAALDGSAARVTVKIGALLTAPLPWLTQRAGEDRTWWAPEPGEQVVVFSPSGELSAGVVMPALYQSAHPAPASARTVHRTVYADGTVIEYDRAAHLLKANVVGSVDIIASVQARLVAPSIVFDGPVTATSTITATGDVIGQGTSLHTHKHVGVTAGGAQTGVPA